jgi:1,4-alpha-glucan branching enzyme
MTIKSKSPVKKITTVKSATKAEVARPAVKKDAPKTQRVTFSVRAEVGSSVFLAGAFNNWDPTAKEMMADKKGDGVYAATLKLPSGNHEYKYVIDGTWCVDPESADCVQNEYGTHNSVKRVV